MNGAGTTGLCERCAHHRTQQSARGSVFHRCGLADDDARFRKYPPLPVIECPGFRPSSDARDRDHDLPAETERDAR